MKLEFFDIFRKILKYQIAWKSVQWEPNCSMRTGGWTWWSNFANAPKNRLLLVLVVITFISTRNRFTRLISREFLSIIYGAAHSYRGWGPFEISHTQCSCTHFLFTFVWPAWWWLPSLAEICSWFHLYSAVVFRMSTFACLVTLDTRFYNRGRECFLRGKSWTFKYNSGYYQALKFTTEVQVRSQVSTVRFVVDNVAMVQVYLRILRFCSVSIIPSMLHTHFHLHVALTGRANGRSLGTFQKEILFGKSGSIGWERIFIYYLKG